MSHLYDYPRRLTIPRVKEARLSNSFSTINGDSGQVQADPESTLNITGAGGITVTATEGSPDSLSIDGSGVGVNHGSLLGLSDDDHTQYLLIDGTRAMTGALRVPTGSQAKVELGAEGCGLYSTDGTNVYFQADFVELFNVSEDGCFFFGSQSAMIRNVASSLTNPTLIPNRTYLTNGIGATASAISLIVGGTDLVNASSAGSVQMLDNVIYDSGLSPDGYTGLYDSDDRQLAAWDSSGSAFKFGDSGLAITTSGIQMPQDTEDFHIIDAGSAGATEQDWVEVTVGGQTGYIRVYSSK